MLLVRRARVPATLLPTTLRPAILDPLEPTLLCDLALAGDRIVAVSLASETPPSAPTISTFDAAGALVFSAFIDAHTHLDKTHPWFRAPNRSGTFAETLTALAHDKDHWTEADLRRRAGFALCTAWAPGTRVIRTHLDTGLPWAERSHATFAQLREEWRGRIAIQTVPLCATDAFLPLDGEKIADLAQRTGASALGGFLIMSPDLPRQLDRTLADSVRIVTSTAADLLGFPTHGRIAPGSPAHLVVFDAHSFSDLLSRPATPRRCIDGEQFHSPRLPAFAELGDRPA